MHLTFDEKYEENYCCFPTLFYCSSLLFNSLKIFRGRHGVSWLKNDVLRTMHFFWKVAMKNFTSLGPWRYISSLTLENMTTRIRLKNRINVVLHTVWACYTHFSDNWLQISMTIYNFTCLYDILYHLEEHSTRLMNYRYIVVCIIF